MHSNRAASNLADRRIAEEQYKMKGFYSQKGVRTGTLILDRTHAGHGRFLSLGGQGPPGRLPDSC